jgi:hypothetical protein
MWGRPEPQASRRLSSCQSRARNADEFTFRLNDGNVKRHTVEWLDDLITATSEAASKLRETDGMKEIPDALNRMADVELAHRPKMKTKAARNRKRLKAKKAKADLEAEKQA